MYEEVDENYELPTWAKIAVVGIRLGFVCFGIGLALLGLGGFSADSNKVCEKKNEGN